MQGVLIVKCNLKKIRSVYLVFEFVITLRFIEPRVFLSIKKIIHFGENKFPDRMKSSI